MYLGMLVPGSLIIKEKTKNLNIEILQAEITEEERKIITKKVQKERIATGYKGGNGFLHWRQVGSYQLSVI